jgi:hypothetical protein
MCGIAVAQTGVTPLRVPQGGSPYVMVSVASQSTEDFIAHKEMHPLLIVVAIASIS